MGRMTEIVIPEVGVCGEEPVWVKFGFDKVEWVGIGDTITLREDVTPKDGLYKGTRFHWDEDQKETVTQDWIVVVENQRLALCVQATEKMRSYDVACALGCDYVYIYGVEDELFLGEVVKAEDDTYCTPKGCADAFYEAARDLPSAQYLYAGQEWARRIRR